MWAVLTAAYTIAATAPFCVVTRFAVVSLVLIREIDEVEARCGRAITAGVVRSKADVRQEFTAVSQAIDRFPLLVLDLRKWTHRQFFPHGSAR